MIKNEKHLLAALREASLIPEAPVQLKDGRWKIEERLAIWKAFGPRIFDEYLDRFQKIAIEVLTERDPQFQLDSEQRFAASLYGKVLKHSKNLRTGLAETLALLGSYPEFLTSCSGGKAEATARLTVRSLLEGADWEVWASLNDVLPLLAEAAPKEFLDAVESALSSDPCPFDRIFAQEGSGLAGRTYITGLLWALEALAWSEDYLIRVVITLGELATRDPGGNWSNRPANSLRTIFLPWFPQTLASIPKRRAAVETLQAELPEVRWKLLISLLPQNHQSSSTTHKPVWRKIIPEDWSEGVSNSDYWEQITAYAELAYNQAQQDRTKIPSLVDHLDKLPPSVREKLLSYLSSETTLWPHEERLSIWNKLTDLVSRHRRFAGAKWAMPPDDVNQIAIVADRLEPESPSDKFRRLFNERDFDLYEERNNHEQQRKNLEERRYNAIKEIYSQEGVQEIIKFSEAVKSPSQVGLVFGKIASSDEDIIILPELLQAESNALIQFAIGFLSGRFQDQGWEWVDNIDMSKWTAEQIALFLAYMPFNSETWTRAKRMLADNESLYWSKTHATPYDAKEDLPWAVNRLLENQRVNAAIRALESMIYSETPIDSELIVKALNALMHSDEELRTMDPHAVVELIKKLQEDSSADQDELLKIEWTFLGLLDEGFGASPTVLEKTLANNPSFFCDVIRIAFRSDKDKEKSEETTKDEETTKEKEGLATNAYRLLNEWKTPPGSQDNGIFDGEALNSWLEEVKSRCAESGHLKIALQQVGEVLFYSPPDPDGLWIHRTVATILNAKEANDLRLGFEVEIFNSRGAYFVDPEGKPEREIATSYRKKAEDLEMNGYHRIATVLREVAESYDREAERNSSRRLLED